MQAVMSDEIVQGKMKIKTSIKGLKLSKLMEINLEVMH